jgi:phosphate-selective porin OprO/OprP
LLRAGHFVEPFGLEANISTSDTTFMERAMVSDALTPYRALGIGFVAPYFDNRMTWGAGVFNRTVDDDPYWDFSTRLTGLPWYEKEGRRLLHLGASYLHQTPNGEIRLSGRPESHLGNMHLDTGSFPAHDVDRWGFETALVVGPFSMQSEYIAAEAEVQPPYRTLSLIDVDKFFKSSRRFDGWYAQASVFVTGENRPYNTEGGWFERIVPRHNFTLGLSGWGAWELALRYSTLDLNDFDIKSGVIGGEGDNWTAGVNWYMTPNTRLMFNYVRSKIKQYEYNGPIDIFQGRFQVDF